MKYQHWPVKREQAASLRELKTLSMQEDKNNPELYRVYDVLKKRHPKFYWTLKALWGFTLFDFWSKDYGIGVILEKTRQHELINADLELRTISKIEVVRVPYQGEVPEFEVTLWSDRHSKKTDAQLKLEPSKVPVAVKTGELSDADCRKFMDALMIKTKKQADDFLDRLVGEGIIPRCMVKDWSK